MKRGIHGFLAARRSAGKAVSLRTMILVARITAPPGCRGDLVCGTIVVAFLASPLVAPVPVAVRAHEHWALIGGCHRWALLILSRMGPRM